MLMIVLILLVIAVCLIAIIAQRIGILNRNSELSSLAAHLEVKRKEELELRELLQAENINADLVSIQAAALCVGLKEKAVLNRLPLRFLKKINNCEAAIARRASGGRE